MQHLDTFDEYQDAFLPQDSGFTPTVCSDKQTKILISKKFNTKEDAGKSLKTESQKELGQTLGGCDHKNNRAFLRRIA